MKVGRNAPCPCGSRKKFKRCCGNLASRPSPDGRDAVLSQVFARAEEALRSHQAAEMVRKQQQGHGKPIISLLDHGYRIVIVGKTICWGKNWLVFGDFLLAFMKNTLGVEWGRQGRSNGNPHPVFRWLAKFSEYTKKHGSGDGLVKSGPTMGFIACWMQFAYALYLLAHHDQIPKRLLRRLRDHQAFLPAYYETVAGAALAVAGFEFSNAEAKKTSAPVPEFRARSKSSGKSYDVEAKRKERWTAPTDDVRSDAFQRELETYIRGRIHSASSKRLVNPIYWIELGIPTLTKEADWRAIAERVDAILRDAQNMTVDGQPIVPAYVVVTNHTFLANEDVEGDPSFGFLGAVNIPDFSFNGPREIEDALASYDRHRDVHWMMKAWLISRTIPTTFDGSPPELLSPDGVPQPTLKIGDTIEVTDETGNPIEGRITEIASAGDGVWAIVTAGDPPRQLLGQVRVSEREAKAAQRYTDAVFGKSSASHPIAEGDLFGLYERMRERHADMSPADIAKRMDNDAHMRRFGNLSVEEFRIRVAREVTKRIWASAQADKK